MLIDKSTALVTGANRGIGKAIVHALERAGVAKVYAAMRDPAAGEFGGRVEIVRVDVLDTESLAAAAERAADVNLLFNNAGVLNTGGILDVPLDLVRRNLDTNFYGKLAVARAFAPVIEKNGGGAIVNTLTLVALASMPGLSVYNASKAAAWSMNQSLRAALAPKHIAVHGVFPGAVDTDMLAGFDMPKTSPREVASAILAGIEADDEDIFPDPMSRNLYAAWRLDHKAVERQFAAM